MNDYEVKTKILDERVVIDYNCGATEKIYGGLEKIPQTVKAHAGRCECIGFEIEYLMSGGITRVEVVQPLRLPATVQDQNKVLEDDYPELFSSEISINH